MIAAQQSWFDLKLAASKTLPRELRFKLARDQLYVWMCLPAWPDHPSLTYASSYLRDCHLDNLRGRHSLWLSTTSFELTADEAVLVANLLESRSSDVRSEKTTPTASIETP